MKKGILRNRTGEELLFAVEINPNLSPSDPKISENFLVYRLPSSHYTPEGMYPIGIILESELGSDPSKWEIIKGSDSVVYKPDEGLKIITRNKTSKDLPKSENLPRNKPKTNEHPEERVEILKCKTIPLVNKEEDYQLGLAADFVTKGTREAENLESFKPMKKIKKSSGWEAKLLPKVNDMLKQLNIKLEGVPEIDSVSVSQGWLDFYRKGTPYNLSHYAARSVDLVDLVLKKNSPITKQEALKKLMDLAKEVGFEYVEYDLEDGLIHCGISREFYLARLNHSLVQDPQDTVSDYHYPNIPDMVHYNDLLQEKAHGWWRHLLEDHFDTNRGQPIVILPEGYYSQSDVRVLPSHYDDNLCLGDVVLQTAWGARLTPKPFFASLNDRVLKRPSIHFFKVPENLLPLSTVPPTLQTLEFSLLPYSSDPYVSFDTKGKDSAPNKLLEKIITIDIKEKGSAPNKLLEETTTIDTKEKGSARNKLLEEIITIIQTRYYKINFYVHTALLQVQVGLEMDASVALPEILDQLCMLINAAWDWHGDMCVYLMSRGVIQEPADISYFKAEAEKPVSQSSGFVESEGIVVPSKTCDHSSYCLVM